MRHRRRGSIWSAFSMRSSLSRRWRTPRYSNSSPDSSHSAAASGADSPRVARRAAESLRPEFAAVPMTSACGPTSVPQSPAFPGSAQPPGPPKPRSGLGDPDPECTVSHREPPEKESQPPALCDGDDHSCSTGCEPDHSQQDGNGAVSGTEFALHAQRATVHELVHDRQDRRSLETCPPALPLTDPRGVRLKPDATSRYAESRVPSPGSFHPRQNNFPSCDPMTTRPEATAGEAETGAPASNC